MEAESSNKSKANKSLMEVGKSYKSPKGQIVQDFFNKKLLSFFWKGSLMEAEQNVTGACWK